jgi:malate dehydrogenase (quinone)
MRVKAPKLTSVPESILVAANPEKLKEWIPLIMEGRTLNEPIAATKIDSGTDVNFGAYPDYAL